MVPVHSDWSRSDENLGILFDNDHYSDDELCQCCVKETPC